MPSVDPAVQPPIEQAPGALVLVVGATPKARQIARGLRRRGLSVTSALDTRDALRRVEQTAPDLIVLDAANTDHLREHHVLRRLRDAPGDQRRFLLVGGDFTESEADGAGRLPAGVRIADLVDRVRAGLSAPRRAAPGRPAISEERLTEETGRELQRAEVAGRAGVLAAIRVAEMPRIMERLGSQAEHAVALAFDELVSRDEHILEQHSFGAGRGFWLLLPESDLATARARLLRLSRQLASTVLDIGGEQVRMTPVIGYADFAGAQSAAELRRQVEIACEDASTHLDLVPVLYSPMLSHAPPITRDRVLAFAERMRSPLQIAFTLAVLLSLPFIVYVSAWYAGFDLTTVTYPLVAAALVATAAALWAESYRALGAVQAPTGLPGAAPAASAIIAAYLPNEAATIVDTVTTFLEQDYPGELQVILAYNSPQRLPVERLLQEIASGDPRLLLLRVASSTSKAQNINAALEHVRGEFVGIFDADHHPAPGSFERAWGWLSQGHDVVQGHCVVRNGEASWVARLIAVEFETIYAVSHPGRARLHGFGIFGGSNGYWRRDALQLIRMRRSMLTEDIDSSMRGLQEGLSIVSDPGLVSTELAPTTLTAFWHQRMRWAQGWTQTAQRHLRPALSSDRLSSRQKLGALFLLGWAQLVPWVTVQVLPILAFNAWRDGGLGELQWLVPFFVLLSIFTLSVGVFQTAFAYMLGDPSVRQHRSWFVLYAVHSTLWFGELKNLIARVAQLKELIGERQWRVTPRAVTVAPHAPVSAGAQHSASRPRGK